MQPVGVDCSSAAIIWLQSLSHETIAVFPKASADMFWQSVHVGAVKGAREDHVNIVWDGPPNETNIVGEMQIMETMVNRQVVAIAGAPSERPAFNPAQPALHRPSKAAVQE